MANRKVRSDKKIDVKPTITKELYSCITRVAHITDSPIKNVGEIFCLNGLYSKIVIEKLSESFRRNYRFKSTIYMGHPELLTKRAKKSPGEKTRISLRFDQDTYNEIADLAYALDITVSSATAILLDYAIKYTDIVNEFIGDYIEEVLEPKRKKQLKSALAFLKKQNPHESEDITLSQFVSYIMNEFMGQSRNIKKAVENWLDQAIKRD